MDPTPIARILLEEYLWRKTVPPSSANQGVVQGGGFLFASPWRPVSGPRAKGEQTKWYYTVIIGIRSVLRNLNFKTNHRA